jgi:AI-2 transport protein TqsA
MAKTIEESRIQTVCLLVLATVAIAHTLHWLQDVLVPFTLALMLAVPLKALMLLLERYLRVPSWLALILTLIFGIACVAGFAGLIVRSVQQVAEAAPDYQQRIHDLAERMSRWLPEGPSTDSILDEVGNRTTKFLVSIVGSVSSVANSIALVLIYITLLLMGVQLSAPSWSRTWDEVAARVREYLAAKMVISLFTGVLVGSVLRLLGVDLAFVFGMCAFLLNFIPNIGSFIATLLPLPLVVGDPNLTALQATLAIAIPGVIQFGIGNIIEPRAMSEGMGLHPVSILFALMFWGAIWGPVGMVLAVPLTAVIKFLISRLEITLPVARLLEGRPTSPPNGTPPSGRPKSP